MILTLNTPAALWTARFLKSELVSWCDGVFPPLLIFGCEIILLETLNPMFCLIFKVLGSKEPGQGRVVSVKVEFLSIEVFMKVFQHFHNCQYLLLSEAVVPLSLE
jgi:hypothetical protein